MLDKSIFKTSITEYPITAFLKHNRVRLEDVKFKKRGVEYICIDRLSFDTFSVKVQSDIPVIMPDNLAARRFAGKLTFIDLPLEKMQCVVKKVTQYTNATLEITAPYVTLVPDGETDGFKL